MVHDDQYLACRLNLRGPSPNGRIHRYGASIFGDIIINVSKSINKEKYFGGCNI